MVHLLAMYEWKAVNKEQQGEPVSFMRLDAVTRDSMVFRVRKHNSDGAKRSLAAAFEARDENNQPRSGEGSGMGGADNNGTESDGESPAASESDGEKLEPGGPAESPTSDERASHSETRKEANALAAAFEAAAHEEEGSEKAIHGRAASGQLRLSRDSKPNSRGTKREGVRNRRSIVPTCTARRRTLSVRTPDTYTSMMAAHATEELEDLM